MLFDVTFDFVLQQVGGDGVKDGTKHKLGDACSTGRIDGSKPDGALGRMQRWPDVIDALHAAHCLPDEGFVVEVTNNRLRDALLAQPLGRCLCPHAGAHAIAILDELRHQPPALIAMCGRHKDHCIVSKGVIVLFQARGRRARLTEDTW